MSRNFIFTIDEYYHSYDRGTDKRKVFLNKKDYLRFITLLYVCNSTDSIHISNFNVGTGFELFDLKRGEPLVAIGAYCLMPNHFHLLLKEIKEGGISKFMQKLITGYTMYFNKKYERTGALFESRFRAEHADEDRYLKYLFSYIHLNPIKLIDSKWREDGIKNKMEARKLLNNYIYSSYLDYLGVSRFQNQILDKKVFPKYFQTIKDFNKEIYDWLFLRQG